MSAVSKGKNLKRPSWDYGQVGSSDTALMTLEMTESVRNAIENVRASQMLQCDVAHAIKDMAKTLKRIDRRLQERLGPIK